MANKKRRNANRKSDLLVYCAFMLWPTIQFLIFYIYVNFNSILLAFKQITIAGGEKTVAWVGFDNLVSAFHEIFGGELSHMMLMSLSSYFITTAISVPLGLFFSYYIYKKMPLSGFFRVVLFMPSILSAIVTVVIYRQFVDAALPYIIYKITGTSPEGLISNPDTTYGTVMFYCIWVGFGTNVLMYSNKMTSMSPEISEAARIDGAVGMKEFWHITLPEVFPTLSIFLVTGVAGIFTNQYAFYSFFSYNTPADAKIQNLGYYLFYQTAGRAESSYPRLASIGLILTAITIPVTFLVRYALDRFGPSEK